MTEAAKTFHGCFSLYILLFLLQLCDGRNKTLLYFCFISVLYNCVDTITQSQWHSGGGGHLKEVPEVSVGCLPLP